MKTFSELTKKEKLIYFCVLLIYPLIWVCGFTNKRKRQLTASDCDITENAQKDGYKAHTLEWITDKQATETETGLKHEECTLCGFKQKENTVISKLSAKVEDAPEKEAPKSPKTGDNDNSTLLYALLLLSGLGVIAAKKQKV